MQVLFFFFHMFPLLQVTHFIGGPCEEEKAVAAAAVILGDVFVQCLRWPAAWLHQLLATASCRSLG